MALVSLRRNNMDSSPASGLKATLWHWAPVFRIIILALICLIAFLIRIFSVIRFESVIHEFDPWFNYRTTRYLAEAGLYEFWNWFDPNSWFPLGRVIGGTLYPGLMITARFLHWTANALSFPLDIRNVCVFIAPIFSALTSLAGYSLAHEVTGRSEAGLLSALFVAIVPSYISRSVAGSYDYEGISIFILIFTFYLWVKSVNTGSIFWSGLTALSFFYMVSSWGGYAFIINVIPIYVVGMIYLGKMSKELYVAYTVFYPLATVLSMQIPFVGFQAVTSSEHMASHAVFLFLQVYVFSDWLKGLIGEERFKQLARLVIIGTAVLCILFSIYVTVTDKMRWTGRSMSLLDPTYAKTYIPIIASVSEHQPTTWSSFFFDTHFLIVFAPVGLYFSLVEPSPAKLFVSLYAVLSVYFASVMVRLLLVLCPALCVLSAVGVSETFNRFTRHITHYREWSRYLTAKKAGEKTPKPKYGFPLDVSVLLLLALCAAIIYYIGHCTWVGAEAYSSPTIIMAHKSPEGGKKIVDDYREAYYWLRMNTPQQSRIMSWWDYGYQITGMGNRTVLVDNNTWNNTHIATMGMIFGSPEEEAAKHLRQLDVDYVLVIFGGMSYYSGDDINKFLWMVRIASGVYPHIKEEDFLNKGSYRIDSGATQTMRDCLMYKLCYYRFGEAMTQQNKPAGYDLVRNAEVADKKIVLKNFKEVYTSEHWLVRIYELKKEDNRGEALRPRTAYLKRSIETLQQYGLSRPKTKPKKGSN